jgi:hypothetical protein
LLSALLLAGILLCISRAQAQKQHANEDKPVILAGRVLAEVETGMSTGTGLGPRAVEFIFEIEKAEAPVRSVEISYQFFNRDGRLPKSFYDHSNLYELRVVRDKKCDVSVDDISWWKNMDVEGNPMPRTYRLNFLDAFPEDMLNPNTVLPCYVLHAGDYKVRE